MLGKKKYILSAVLLLVLASFMVSTGIDFTNTRIMYSASDAKIIFYNTTGNDSVFVIDSDLYGNTRLIINGSTGLVNISENLTIESFNVAGFVKNNANGLLSGGNSIVIGDISAIGDARWLLLSGANANQNINIGIYNFTTSGNITASAFFGDGGNLTNQSCCEGKKGVNIETLGKNNKTLTVGIDEMYQYLDEGDTNRYVNLSTIGATSGDFFSIKHNGSHNDNHYIRINQSNIILDYIYSGGFKKYVFDGTNWIGEDIGTGDTNTNNCNIIIGSNAIGYNYGTAIGYSANASVGGTAVGANAVGTDYSVAIGLSSDADNHGVAVGNRANGIDNGIAVGDFADAHVDGSAIGNYAYGYDWGVAFGAHAEGYNWGLSIGFYSKGSDHGMALGYHADARDHGIAIGNLAGGTNYSIAIGYNSTTIGNNVTAIGSNTTNSGNGSVVIGNNATNNIAHILYTNLPIYSPAFHGDGGNLTNISGIGSNPFNQWLNTTDNASFNYLDILHDVNISGILTVDGTSHFNDGIYIGDELYSNQSNAGIETTFQDKDGNTYTVENGLLVGVMPFFCNFLIHCQADAYGKNFNSNNTQNMLDKSRHMGFNVSLYYHDNGTLAYNTGYLAEYNETASMPDRPHFDIILNVSLPSDYYNITISLNSHEDGYLYNVYYDGTYNESWINYTSGRMIWQSDLNNDGAVNGLETDLYVFRLTSSPPDNN